MWHAYNHTFFLKVGGKERSIIIIFSYKTYPSCVACRRRCTREMLVTRSMLPFITITITTPPVFFTGTIFLLLLLLLLLLTLLVVEYLLPLCTDRVVRVCVCVCLRDLHLYLTPSPSVFRWIDQVSALLFQVHCISHSCSWGKLCDDIIIVQYKESHLFLSSYPLSLFVSLSLSLSLSLLSLSTSSVLSPSPLLSFLPSLPLRQCVITTLTNT